MRGQAKGDERGLAEGNFGRLPGSQPVFSHAGPYGEAGEGQASIGLSLVPGKGQQAKGGENEPFMCTPRSLGEGAG